MPIDTSTEQLPRERLAAQMLERLAAAPLEHLRWDEDHSTVEIVVITPRLSLVSSRGPGHPNSKPFYTEHAPKTCRHEHSVIFWDLGALTSTDLSVVRTCVGIGKDNRHNLAKVHMFYASPFVGMAVTVANVALGGLLQLHPGAESFMDAFVSATAEA